jgi:hypothetical protein
VFSKEIAGLNPRYVVLFTNMYFNEYLEKLLFDKKSSKDIGKRRTITVTRGKEKSRAVHFFQIAVLTSPRVFSFGNSLNPFIFFARAYDLTRIC